MQFLLSLVAVLASATIITQAAPSTLQNFGALEAQQFSESMENT